MKCMLMTMTGKMGCPIGEWPAKDIKRTLDFGEFGELM